MSAIPKQTKSLIWLRRLIIAYTVTLFAAWLLPYSEIPLTDVAWNLMELDGTDGSLPTSNVLYWLILFLWLLACAAIWSLYPYSREAFLGYTILTTVLVLPGGTRVVPAIDGFVLSVSLLLNGAVLALAYGGEVSIYFKVRMRDGGSA